MTQTTQMTPQETCRWYTNLDKAFGTKPEDRQHHDQRCPIHGAPPQPKSSSSEMTPPRRA